MMMAFCDLCEDSMNKIIVALFVLTCGLVSSLCAQTMQYENQVIEKIDVVVDSVSEAGGGISLVVLLNDSSGLVAPTVKSQCGVIQ